MLSGVFPYKTNLHPFSNPITQILESFEPIFEANQGKKKKRKMQEYTFIANKQTWHLDTQQIGDQNCHFQ